MDNQDYAGQGHVYLAVTFILGFFGWIGDNFSMGEIFKGISMTVSIVAGIMAIRYYFFATKSIKNKK